MTKRIVACVVAGAVAALSPLAPAYGQMPWAPGAEIVGHSIQVQTNGVANTIYFDAGGAARIITPGGTTVPATWTAANQQLCLQTGGGQECWPYQSAFQTGQAVTLTSSCQVASQWLPMSTAPMSIPEPMVGPERG